MAMIDKDTIDRIFSAIRIEEVVGDYVSLRRRGANLIGLCPFHNEKTPSFNVNPARGIYKCFGCGHAGNAVNFIMEIEQENYPDALRRLAKKYGIDVKERELTDEQRAQQNIRESLFVVNEMARDWFMDSLHNTQEGQNIGLSYFRERGLSDEVIRTFQLGYSPERSDALAKEAIKRGYKEEFLTKAGLCGSNERGLYDRFHGRVIYPVFSLSGRVVAFGGRILKKNDKMAKYVNSPENEIYHKSNELYGLFQAKQSIAKENRCYLVEGYMDVISMHQSGVKNVVASSGTSLTTGQVKLIHRFTENVTVLYDGDAAGIHASVRGIDMLLEEGLNIRVVALPEGEDPDSFAQQHNASDFVAYIEEHSVDFIRFKTDLLKQEAGDDPVKRARLISSIVQSISVIPDMVVRQVYLQECARQLGISEQVLSNEVIRLKQGRQVSEVERRKREANAARLNSRPLQERSDTDSGSAGGGDAQVSTFDLQRRGDKLFKEETNVLRLLVKFGSEVVYPADESGEETTVSDVIRDELTTDGIGFNTDLYQQMFDEQVAFRGTQEERQRHFFYHDNPEMARLAVNLGTERYTLNSTQKKQFGTVEERLEEWTYHVIYELKFAYVKQLILQKQEEMKTADEKRQMELLSEIATYNDAKKLLSEELGGRN